MLYIDCITLCIDCIALYIDCITLYIEFDYKQVHKRKLFSYKTKLTMFGFDRKTIFIHYNQFLLQILQMLARLEVL